MASKKKPGARPGDFIFRAQRGPVPLPPLEKFNPSLRANNDWSEMIERVSEDSSLEKNAEFQAKMGRALFQFIMSGLPDDYRDGFADGVGIQEIEQLFNAWSEDVKKRNGGVGLGESSGS